MQHWPEALVPDAILGDRILHLSPVTVLEQNQIFYGRTSIHRGLLLPPSKLVEGSGSRFSFLLVIQQHIAKASFLHPELSRYQWNETSTKPRLLNLLTPRTLRNTSRDWIGCIEGARTCIEKKHMGIVFRVTGVKKLTFAETLNTIVLNVSTTQRTSDRI